MPDAALDEVIDAAVAWHVARSRSEDDIDVQELMDTSDRLHAAVRRLQ